ncbi:MULTISPECIES: winged helix-turn-helix domain-containing protein [unclassified Streptomyces]|uniref:winged helix-turn-helix domain-containing protein n=1 Tax=unclassified Streptomyces TaxID=2593676 RepID=UPI0033D63CD1
MAALEIDHQAPEPPYRQIAADLTGQIKRGELLADRPIPSEKVLTDRYGVARNTVRSAIAVLRENGLVYTVPNRGTYVRNRSTEDEHQGN